MKQQYNALPGVSLLSITLPAGNGIKGISIDNDSGGWLYVLELRDWCPPYVHNWTRDMDYTGAAITVQYGTAPNGGSIVAGPAAQVVTNQGDGYTVTLYDEQIGFSNGTPENYIEQFTPILSRGFHAQPFVSGGGSNVFLPPIPGKRYRVLTTAIQLTISQAPGESSSPTTWQLASTTTNVQLAAGAIYGGQAPGYPQTLPVDAPVGEGLTLNSVATYSQNSGFVLIITYMVI